MTYRKLVLGSSAALVVFTVGVVPPYLFYLFQTEGIKLYQAFPKAWALELVSCSILFTALYLFAMPASSPRLRSACFGALAGLLTWLPSILSLESRAVMSMVSMGDVSFYLITLSVFSTTLWHVAMWGAAGIAVAWASGKCSGENEAAGFGRVVK